MDPETSLPEPEVILVSGWDNLSPDSQPAE